MKFIVKEQSNKFMAFSLGKLSEKYQSYQVHFHLPSRVGYLNTNWNFILETNADRKILLERKEH